MASGSTLRPVARPLVLREQIHERLRAAILTGELAAGSPVIEAEIAARLGASRTPVREALRRLESEGLLVPRGGRGTVVRSIDADEVRCIFEIREALEALAARRAAPAIDAATLVQLEAAFEAMRDALDDPSDLERADTAFHDLILGVARGARLTRLLTEIHDEMVAYRFLSLRDPARRRETLEEHAAILAALRARDPEAAAQAMARHVARAGAAVAARAVAP